MSAPVVAVIDIGSNSIKVLVATRSASDGILALATRTIDARISAGISKADPRLTEDGMTRGLDAIGALLEDAAAFAPARVILVATSAVRDAKNGGEFRARVAAATGDEIRILTGDEEANLIGRGLTCDPALAGLRDFYVFDLGGGSLECLAFRNRKIEQAISLQLGCVRLTEKFVADPSAPLTAEAVRAITEHTCGSITASGFRFVSSVAIGTGGTVSTARAIFAARAGKSFEQTETHVFLAQLRALLLELGALTLNARKGIPGLPPARADVFPTALVTLIALAELGGFDAYRNSLFNLRYGLAAEALDSLS
jgi:exopolyphosphatase/guanosine-5'-triphosphate,3'-diphosphate pyrophosphatase